MGYNRTGRIHGDDERRFWSKIDKSGDCWLWLPPVTRKGYGRFTVRYPERRAPLAHRYSWEMVNGPVPEGMELDHLCRNRRCVNPAHLEPVTHEENIRRMPRKTHCPKGHPYSGANLYVNPTRFARICRTCLKEHERAWRRRKAAERRAAREGQSDAA